MSELETSANIKIDKLLWWIMGLNGSFIVISISLFISVLLSLNARISSVEVSLQGLKTTSEVGRPGVEADHVILTNLNTMLHEKNIMLDNIVSTLRELKTASDALNSQQIAIRETTFRLEDKLLHLQKDKK